MTARKLSEARIGHLTQFELVDELVGVFGVWIERREEPQRLARRDLREQSALLEHQGNARLELGALFGRIEAQNARGAAVRPPIPLQNLDRRRLASAVGTE